MIQTGFESRVKIQQIISNQLPEFVLEESPKVSEFLKQYYISQEYQGGPVDIADNLDQYLKLDYLKPEVIVDSSVLTSDVSISSDIIFVSSTKGFPNSYGLIKIDDEIITYTGITTNSFTGCVRGFSGITKYQSDLDQEELVFEESSADSHVSGTLVENLSALFLKEFYKKFKYTFTPGLENYDFVDDLNVGNFVKEIRFFYQSKGSAESFRILFNILFGETPQVIDLENFLLKPSFSEYIRRQVIIVESLSGDPSQLTGQFIQKISDPSTTSSVSEVEIFTRNDKVFYKIFLFLGNDESSPKILGDFNNTPASKVIDKVSIGSSVITVDSTIGFPDSGVVTCGNNTVTYQSKNINQFLDCTGIFEECFPAELTSLITETYIGYENGDISKRVEFRIFNVISKFVSTNSNIYSLPTEKIGIKSVGRLIDNPSVEDNQKTKLEIFANSWVYNTSTRYEIENVLPNGSSIVLKNDQIDKSSLRESDAIEIVKRGTQQILDSTFDIVIANINTQDKKLDLTVNITTLPDYSSNSFYDIRRKIKKASSSNIPIKYGNNQIISDIQNVYTENNTFAYVASNSLPSKYEISVGINEISIGEASLEQSTIDPSSKNSENRYSILSFQNPLSYAFVDGSRVEYFAENNPIPGLSEGDYYIEIVNTNRNKIKLYRSRSIIGTDKFETFLPLGPGTGQHKFILKDQSSRIIEGSKSLKRFSLSPNLSNVGKKTSPGTVGMLVNGVEILNYKSDDKIYYGPLNRVFITNSGKDYDVINPPLIEVSSDTGSGAKIQPVISGSVRNIFVEQQEFDIDSVVSINITGGNGKGANLNPIISLRRRELSFDARTIDNFGNLDANNDYISFDREHNLENGEPIIYDPGLNASIEIGAFQDPLNSPSGKNLIKGATYYPKSINSKTIEIYSSILDYNSGINTIGFTTANISGIHKFRTLPKKTLTKIDVVNSGSGYTNRKLIVNPTGISTISSTINFENHGFSDGELVRYNYEDSGIVGLSSSLYYFILKVDDKSFRLSDAGEDGTNLINYQRRRYSSLDSSGSGYQYFSYPEISVNIQFTNVGVGTTTSTKTIKATAEVEGGIIDSYLYETGSNYGSEILNLHKKPNITIKNGKNAQLDPIVVDGRIDRVNVLYGGVEYYSTPTISVSGSGSGAVLKPIIVNNKIRSVIVQNPGIGYGNNTKLTVVSSGSNAVLDVEVRNLTINNYIKYGGEVLSQDSKDKSSLKYSVCGYENMIRNIFNDTNPNAHSPIIGWAYDGNPIYGPYGYSDFNTSTNVKSLVSGYTLDPNNINNRPSLTKFIPGFFVEDYKFTDSGDLDESNGRFAITPQFPNGIYAYFVGLALTESTLKPNFPYFIGDFYKSEYPKENNFLSQSFDFNSSKLIRNTFPYKLGQKYAYNDFIIDSTDLSSQKSTIESVSKGEVDFIEILNPGSNYKVGDSIIFSTSNGDRLDTKVSSVVGKGITSLITSIDSYSDALVFWDSPGVLRINTKPSHRLKDGENVLISSVSNNNNKINGYYKIGVTSAITSIASSIPSTSTVGLVTDIYLVNIPSTQTISIGSSISINSEIFTVLNVFSSENILRTRRSLTGIAHSIGNLLYFTPDTFTIQQNVPYFESIGNQIVYFNPKESVGIGTTSGTSNNVQYSLGINKKNISVPTQSIFIPNHPFKTNQEIVFKIPSTPSLGNLIGVSTSSGSTPFTIPISGNEQKLYIINKSKDFIGLVTQIGLTTTTDGLFFTSFAPNGDDRDFQYSLETTFTPVTAKVEKKVSTIETVEEHHLSDGDEILLNVKSNQSVGIGTSNAIRVLYEASIESLIINPIEFSSSGINTTTNVITVANHNLLSGDKIFYSANTVASGLNTGSYFIYRIDDNQIMLSETKSNLDLNPAVLVDISDTGGSSHTIAPINPQIQVTRNNSLVFDVTHPSLFGYNFGLFYDKNFTSKFVSTGSTSVFSSELTGEVGVGTTTRFILNYSDSLPEILYYTITKNGDSITTDVEVPLRSEIIFVDSRYSKKYSISGITSTTFDIVLINIPESNNYNQQNCNTLEYKTNSKSVPGGISDLSIISSKKYSSIPFFTESISENGLGASFIINSNSIGKIQRVDISNQGIEYAIDKTIRPLTQISPEVLLESANTISSVEVVNGGKNYIAPPNLIIFDDSTKKVINSGLFNAKLSGSTISTVEIVDTPKGLPSGDVRIVAVNNTNGISITKVENSLSGIVTCTITTPLSGFSLSPFPIGSKIYVEGIQKNTLDGTGLNSSDYEYQFFTVKDYITSIPAKVVFDLSEFSTNIGIANTFQEGSASIISFSNYPKFNLILSNSPFIVGERLLTKLGIQDFVERDLFVENVTDTSIKISGNYKLSVGEIIRGFVSRYEGKVYKINEDDAEFEVDYSTEQTYGWIDQVGFLNNDIQVLPDNDYYQNLSYTIKSKITFDELITPVNSLVHSSGLKNFSDTQIFSLDPSVSLVSSVDETGLIIDNITENRVDAINNYDLALDINTFDNSSKFIKLKNKKLTNYLGSKTNRVLKIDDISNLFSNRESINIDFNVDNFTILEQIESSSTYNSYLIQVGELSSNNMEIHEIVVLNDNKNIFSLQKNYLANGDFNRLSQINPFQDEFGAYSLRFSPSDPFNNSFSIKILNQKFNGFSVGYGVSSIGFVDLISSNRILDVGISSTTIYNLDSSSYSAVHSIVQVLDDVTKDINYVELYIVHDGLNTYQSEFFFNNTSNSLSINEFGTFTSYLDSDSGTLKLDYIKPNNNKYTIRSRNVGFAQTSIGIGTYRFLSAGEVQGTEKTLVYSSNYAVTIGSASTVYATFDSSKFSTFKGMVEIIGSEKNSLHQVITLNNISQLKSYTMQSPTVSVGATSGIGTFGAEYSGSNINLIFYPDPSISGIVTVKSFIQGIYLEPDFVNIPPSLVYGAVSEKLSVISYFGINDENFNNLTFPLSHNGTPIFEKTFNPSDFSILDTESGIIRVVDHFFNTGEELIYTPFSTFGESIPSAIGIGSTMDSNGNITNILPSIVYPIKITKDTIKLSTRKEYALSGIGVTFINRGSGNAHKLEMTKKNTKAIISIDDLVQSPISYTGITHDLFGNGGLVGSASTYISLTGISSIISNDLLQIDDEFVRVINVGLGTTSQGPITNFGDVNLVEVRRSFVGSAASSHTDGTTAVVYRGSYNIVGSDIYFTAPPKGNFGETVGSSNIEDPQSEFNGRVFLRQDYTTNQIFDNISPQFTGLDQLYTLTVSGLNTTGLGTTGGSGIILLNSIFQSPSASNNVNNNYEVIEDNISGITSVKFTGITSVGGSIIISDNDVNQNQLPRGGLIVSLGSTNGLGFAPLVGASVTAVLLGGSIVAVGVGSTDYHGSGYNGLVSIGVSVYEQGHTGAQASISALVGAGGSLSFTVNSGGSGYINPEIFVGPPSYENLEVVGVSRLGIGSTTQTGTGLLVSLEVGASSATGIGSTLFEVSSFKISRQGYGFRKGDVISPIGLVTARGYAAPILPFEITVTEVFNDDFASWQFGEFNYIDSIKNLQDNIRVRFPLNFNGELLSFEKDNDDPDSQLIDFGSLLLIFVNGVLQNPGIDYLFEGGSTFSFSSPPKPEDNISIFFYLGTSGQDSFLVEASATIKEGDQVQLFKSNQNLNTTLTQNKRTITLLNSSDILETNSYSSVGIDNANYKPLTWYKQKADIKINDTIVYKTRDSLETTLYPAARIIKDVNPNSTEIHLDTVDLFDYEDIGLSESIGAIIVDDSKVLIPGKIVAGVGIGSTVILSVVNNGSGYVGSSLTVIIGPPPLSGFGTNNTVTGIGTTANATAIVSIVNGSLGTISVTNGGFGYDPERPPSVLIPPPSPIYDNITNIEKVNILGNSGRITGISTTKGINTPLAITFTLSSGSGISTGDAIYIYDTAVGSGVTSIDFNNNDIVAIGTQFVDNVYYVHFVNNSTGIITCNIRSSTSVIGLNSTGSNIGKFSWGKLSNVSKSNPVSIAVTGKTSSGLSTYPSLQRRGYGLRSTGAVSKTLL
jgi:hypothetical protein